VGARRGCPKGKCRPALDPIRAIVPWSLASVLAVVEREVEREAARSTWVNLVSGLFR